MQGPWKWPASRAPRPAPRLDSPGWLAGRVRTRAKIISGVGARPRSALVLPSPPPLSRRPAALFVPRLATAPQRPRRPRDAPSVSPHPLCSPREPKQPTQGGLRRRPRTRARKRPRSPTRRRWTQLMGDRRCRRPPGRPPELCCLPACLPIASAQPPRPLSRPSNRAICRLPGSPLPAGAERALPPLSVTAVLVLVPSRAAQPGRCACLPFNPSPA